MRITDEIVTIDYNETKNFFKKRAEKYSEDNPYSVTMYQDGNKELVEKKNQKEVQKLLPLLKLNPEAKVLDIACGIGRWADAMPQDIEEYCGVDFSEELIQIARKRNIRDNCCFLEGAVDEIENVVTQNNKGKFNRILMMGILVYLNDKELENAFAQIERICQEHAVICIREPIGIKERLTLKDFFSDELKDNYNAIYRARQELLQFFETAFLGKGFKISQEGFVFDENALNNRKETAQYFYVLER